MTRRLAARAGLAALCLGAVAAGPAMAHVAERGLVMLLPTDYYLVGGSLAVLASFLVLTVIPGEAVVGASEWRLVLAGGPRDAREETVGKEAPSADAPCGSATGTARDARRPSVTAEAPDGRFGLHHATSLASFAVMAVLILGGLFGSRDPLANPLPLAVWTVFWVGLVILHALAGHLWHWLNPWSGPLRLSAMAGWRRAPFVYPRALGMAPGILGLLAFTWAELIDPAPDDTGRLAAAVAAYWAVSFLAMLLFGEAAWRARGECFSIFLRLVSRLAPLGRDARGRLVLSLPGARALESPLGPGGVAFLLLALAAVSFDGLDGTFWYLGLIGVNPLEYPGRTAVMEAGTLGLLATWAAMGAGFVAAVGLGARLAGGVGLREAAGALVVSLLPIALAYHVAHYLTLLLVNGQYALAAFSDPFGTGLDLLGLADLHVTTSFLTRLDTVRVIWNVQAGAIVIGHVVAVLMAHAMARRLWPERSRSLRAEAPLAVLMVGYTLFGLWLMATPTGA